VALTHHGRGRVAGRLRSLAAGFLVSGVLAASSVVGSGWVTPAAADPPLTVEEAKAQVDRLQMEAAALDQDYVDIQTQIAAKRQRLASTQADLTEQQAKVARMRLQVSRVALAQFQNRNLDTTAQLFFTSDTTDFLNQISTVEKVSQNQNSVLQDFQAAQAELDSLRRTAQTDLAQLDKQEAQLTSLRQESDAKVAEAQAVLDRLTEEQRQRIEAEERRLAAAARAAAEAAIGSAPTEGEDPSSTGGGTITGSSRGAKALAWAKTQVGKPYRFAAAGPSTYDCSGLTLKAWAKAGVSLPHSSRQQAKLGKPVSQAELQPGDLVFFYSGPSHVGMYAGNGMLLHAPRPGKSVEYIKMSAMPFNSAVRPG
jgi:peptidoglycan DL-endopeptidase CwlO